MTLGGKRPGAGRPRKPAAERRSVVVNVRLTPPEYRAACKIAEARKIAIPDVLREPITKLVAHTCAEK
jgi:hypothetical protein